jgi:hypothetical protein
VLVAPGCGSAPTGGGSNAVVPWVNRPLPLYVAPQVRLLRYATVAPSCRASQLRVRRGRSGVATGNALEELVFTNVSSGACLLRGYPAISGVGEDGGRVPLRPGRGTFFGRLVPSDLPPGGHVFLDFGTSGCGCTCERSSPVRHRDLVFTLPRSGGSLSGGAISLVEDCFLDMSAFGLPERFSQPRTRPGTPGTPRVHMRLPAALRAGTAFRYVVTLRNPTGEAVSLARCPGYTESLYTARSPAGRSESTASPIPKGTMATCSARRSRTSSPS